MELSLLIEDLYKITTVSKNGESEPFKFFDSLNPTYGAHVDGLLALLETVSKSGLHGLARNQSKCVDSKEKIYEFRKGDLRLFYFIGDGDILVICTSAQIKKTQKVSEKHVKKAIKLKTSYKEAVKSNKLIILG